MGRICLASISATQHYLAAERLQEHARALAAVDESPDAAETAARVQRRMADLADAQAHAALALAAVLGLSAHLGAGDAPEWRDAAGRRPEP